ncbi:protein kinase domain-containing protein [Nocardia sp. CA-135398]|uniref:protein kinase domain-containing protein n=1 Tax=Nocardia sp. CA-135398 TaxID=3239977 RepID=UPI003D95FD9A
MIAGRFRLTGALGSGNMGEVHRAEDTHAADAASVAVKLIRRNRYGQTFDSDTDLKIIDRFEREIRIMRKLVHPNLPRTIDGGVDESGIPYLAMEFLDGHTLADLIGEGPLPISWVAAIGAQIAAGLTAAHDSDVVHRDLKPANVMLVRGGAVKVLDFGMGRILGDVEDRLTSTGVAVGTARYMAPEQCRAERMVTPAADLYSLGCVLYEMITGVPPFTAASSYELTSKHINDPVPPIGPQRPEAPPGLLRLIEQLLTKDPADRPDDARTVGEALLSFAVGQEQIAGWHSYDPVAYCSAVTVAESVAQDVITDSDVEEPEPSPGIGMDVFGLHQRLISDYRAFTEGGLIIRDPDIKEFVRKDLEAKSQWPDPWISLNPFFASGGHLLELAGAGILHEECVRIFQRDKTVDGTLCDGTPLTLHQHQREAIEAAQSGESYVLTTGTGSGKSLSYIVPIVDRVLQVRDNADTDKRVRAIIVYPMNALANSQREELKKYLTDGYGEGREPVTYARYTGQEDEIERDRIRNNPPDILLTNYVMLELMLTRPEERKSLIRMAKNLKFLVFDELHTYRGRQGADVALLIRRVREACQADALQCIGTSATMSTEGSFDDQRRVVAEVASALFGTTIAPERVIGETLVRATDPEPETVPAERLSASAPRDYASLVKDPLARWIESYFGLDEETESGRVVRQRPAKIETAAAELARHGGLSAEKCARAIRETLEAGSQVSHPVTGRPLFAFRLHQFLSKGDTVYVTLEDPRSRSMTRDYQLEEPGTRKIFLPLAFCRECGQEYLAVFRTRRDGCYVYEPRKNIDATGGDRTDGHLYIDSEQSWPRTVVEAIENRRLPESWLEPDKNGEDTVRKSYLPRLPRPVTVDPFGTEDAGELHAVFIPSPFLFCLHCGVSYEQTRGRDFARLASLDQEARSSATSLVSASIVRALNTVPADALDKKARKLLSFVDNRQDAALQAGHFNDFVQVAQLRGALYRALTEAGVEGLQHEELASRVTNGLSLRPADYVKVPDPAPALARNAARTLRDTVAFRLYLDLERGWRVTMPNLEQTGLLRIDYPDVEWTAAQQDRWSKICAPLRNADSEQRAEIMRVLLDQMRWGLAIDVQHFRDDFDTLKRASEERLRDNWALSDSDRPRIGTAYPQGSKPGMDRSSLFLSGRGKFAKYLRRKHFRGLKTDDLQVIIADLLKVMADAGLVTEVTVEPTRTGRARYRREPARVGYRVASAAMVWRAGPGKSGVHDPVNRTYASGDGPRVNKFFRQLYQETASELAGMRALEHTAQIDPGKRKQRETAFRRAELPVMYCSPTMELGVDIASLNAVLMRNVPPTPANYVQRSGRAGRQGQPALVVTYCANGNSHDHYYFRRSERMVAGKVQPPRLDLANEDLVRSHIQAIWLAETGLALGRAIPNVIEIGYDEDARHPDPALPLHDHVIEKIMRRDVRERSVRAARTAFGELLSTFSTETTWWDDQWLEQCIEHAHVKFDNAFGRWRILYRAALIDQAEQNCRRLDHTLTERDRQLAASRRKEAETRLDLLKNEGPESKSVLSDFNPYRYLASEGFLPGYSFPRLPLAAYIPSGRGFGDGDYLQRSRFVAIREFGPGALIYHEGARYQVDRIQLESGTGTDVVTSAAKRCAGCGYHHPAEDRADRCEMCKTPLPEPTTGLLKLHTVYTKLRERITSDEEERRRAGFRLMTSYRFNRHGARPGRRDALVFNTDQRIATVSYGDSATVRITNVGRLRAKEDEPYGYWLDPADGSWMNEADAADAAGDTSELRVADADGNQRYKKRVLPYVEDSRNIVVLTLAEPVERPVALSVMFALERGIEARFELEDSELEAELLPPDNGPRDRILFTEAAEGGAGVLRRLEAEPHALRDAAREALQICHFDADGNDLRGSGAEGACARGCYDCLLTYSNQPHHAEIDRHAARDLLRRLAAAETWSTGPGESRTEQQRRLVSRADSTLEEEFTKYLKDNGFRLPDEAQVLVPGAAARADFVYFLPGGNVAVFIDGPVHDHADIAERDEQAEERLFDLGWDVVRVRYDDAWDEIVRKYPRYFGVKG